MNTLAKWLADDIASVQKDPMEPEFVLVPNRAQGVWLRHIIAERNGVCANVEFILSGNFLGSRIGRRGKASGAVDPFTSDSLTLRIFKLLREKRDKKKELPFSFRDNSDEDLIAVASKLAEVLASYQMLRPEMIEEWQKKAPEDKDSVETAVQVLAKIFAKLFARVFAKASKKGTKSVSEKLPDNISGFMAEYRRQKKLWRELGFKEEELPAIRYRKFLSGELNGVDLPKRVFVFAPSSLPSTHFKLFRKLSEQMSVYFYYHNLSEDLWTELKDEKQRLKDELREMKKPEESQSHEDEKETQLASELEKEARRLEDEESLLMRRLEEVQSEPFKELLLLWGKAARPLARALIDESLLDSSKDEDELPGYDTLLHTMQSEIRRSISDKKTEDGKFAQRTKGEDCSLRVHIAPSMFREIEILYDDLVSLFHREKYLRAKDVLIMFPNIEEYAPLIHAVFTKSAFPHYSIADRLTVENFPGISAFFALLRVASGDVRVTEISGLLEMTPIARKLGLSTEEIPELQKFLRESNAHWGLSEKDRREKFGVTSTAVDAERFFFNNSLAFGLRRGALGVMLGEDAESKGALKFGSLEISESDVSKTAETTEMLSKLSKLLNGIKALRKGLLEKEKRKIGDWCDFFRNTILNELLDIEDLDETERLESALDSISEGDDGLDVECEACVVVKLLEAHSWEQRHDTGMLQGKLTFCSLQPLRNIPARVIYVGGMGWGKFPRGGARSTLDLVSNWPTGLRDRWNNWDSTAKDKDNLLLLEILLSAKDYLRFSYVGYDVVSHGEIPPASALAKIIENAGIKIVRDHKLHTSDLEEQSFCDIALATDVQSAAPTQSFASEAGLSRSDILSHRERARRQAVGPEISDFGSFSRTLQSSLWEIPPRSGGVGHASHRLTSFPLTEDEVKKFNELKLEDLVNFFVDPAGFLCKERLNLKGDWRDDPLSDSDPDETKLGLRDNVLKIFKEISLEKREMSLKNLLEQAKEIVERKAIVERARGKLSAFTNEEEASEELLKSPGNDKKGAPKPSALEELVRKILFGEREEEMIAPLGVVTVSFAGANTSSVVAHFKNVFKIGEEAVFVLFPKNKSKWSLSIYAVVAAALIHEDGEYKNFRVVASNGEVETTATVTADSLENSGLTLGGLVADFLKGLEEPPLLFWGTPLVETKRDRKRNIIEETEKEKEGRYYDAAKKALKTSHTRGKDDNSPNIAPADRMEMRLVFGKDLSKSCMPLLEKSLTFVKKISIAVGKL